MWQNKDISAEVQYLEKWTFPQKATGKCVPVKWEASLEREERGTEHGEVEEILRMKGYSRNTAVYHAWRPTRHNKASQKALRNMAIFEYQELPLWLEVKGVWKYF